MSTVIWSKSKPDIEFQYGGRFGEFLIMDANGGYCPMPSCHTFFESSRRADVKLSLTRNAATYRFRDIRDEMAF